MTSPANLTEMRQTTFRLVSPDPSSTRNTSILRSDVLFSNEISHPKMATCTSLSAATPRSSHLLPREPTSLMDTAIAPITTCDNKLLNYTADVQQGPDITECSTQPPTKQSAQLDSMLLTRLPRELRDKIYREAVLEDNEVPIHVTRFQTEDGEHRRCLQIEHPLMRACKQTRQEVSNIYYLENTFRITGDLIEKRAMRKLNRLLTPWAERMKELRVSHDFSRGGGCSATINFSVSATQGLTLVKPETCSLHLPVIIVNPTDNNRDALGIMKSTSSKTCFCKIFNLTLQGDRRDILSWMQEYVDFIVLQTQTEQKSLPYCWNCSGDIII